MTVTAITTHIEDALNRLLTQYKKKPLIAQTITALIEQIQDLEDSNQEFYDKRALETATGIQLDLLGTIVGQGRGTLDDDDYRILIKVKIGQNTSQGGPVKVIDIFQLLTQAATVYYQNLGGGGVELEADAVLPQDSTGIYASMEQVVAAGVRIDAIICYDAVEPFAFAGSNTLVPAFGFGDSTNAATGGKLAEFKKNLVPFAFDGDDINSEGFGTINDPLAGGTLIGIGG